MRQMYFVVFVLILGLTGVVAQDEADITLEPFSSTHYGITGLVPAGWTEVAEGTFARARNLTDVATLVQQAVPMTSDALLTALLPQLALTEAPESVGVSEMNGLIWTLYNVEVVVPIGTIAVDFALSEQGESTLLFLLQSDAEEREELYDAVFVPALEALMLGGALLDTGEVEDLDYYAEDVVFGHGEITLAGTLTLPEADGIYPAVILISGSGAQDRDESLEPVASIKPFRLIADYLTGAGYAVLRYDDRGFGASTGDFESATSADFAEDVGVAMDYLLTRPEIAGERIGLLGHSEGGLVAAMVASNRDDVAFVISMAGTSVSGRDVLVVQNERIQEAAGLDEETIARQVVLLNAFFDAVLGGDEEAQAETLYELVYEQLQGLPEEALGEVESLETYAEALATQQLPVYQGAWMQFFLRHNPFDDWSEIDVPVLVLLGELDVQVDATQQRVAYDEALANNDDYSLVVFPMANHLFQDAVTGAVDEYGTLEQDFTSEFLPTIEAWLDERFGD